MANFLIVCELVDDQVPPMVLEIVGQARRVASVVGATVFVLLPLPVSKSERLDEIGVQLSRHGADRVVAATLRDASAPRTNDATELVWSTVGAQILSILEAVPPRLVLFPLTAGAREVAPRVAARINAAYLADGWFELRNGQLALGEEDRGLDGEIEFPVVMTIGPARYAITSGSTHVDVDILPSDGVAPEWETAGPLSAPAPRLDDVDYRRIGQLELLGPKGQARARGLCRIRCGSESPSNAHFAVEIDVDAAAHRLGDDA